MPMTSEHETTRGVQDFDVASFMLAYNQLSGAVNSGAISMRDATTLVAVMDERLGLFADSISTPHFAVTLGLLERLTSLRRTSSNMDLVDSAPAFALL